MEQLTLPFTPESDTKHRIVFCKNDIPLFTLEADSIAAAQAKRRSLVTVLQRDFRSRTVWEDNPRPTGWWGVRPGKGHASADVYNVIIETT